MRKLMLLFTCMKKSIKKYKVNLAVIESIHKYTSGNHQVMFSLLEMHHSSVIFNLSVYLHHNPPRSSSFYSLRWYYIRLWRVIVTSHLFTVRLRWLTPMSMLKTIMWSRKYEYKYKCKYKYKYRYKYTYKCCKQCGQV